ncbi:hypothetical protein, partial [Roseomonas sp. CECT 9278]|uniref:hypothetical protein n=1 Tax=Roseomonas sp. CECT 9278 TaxID=2845823 RepID=UPI001E29A0BC
MPSGIDAGGRLLVPPAVVRRWPHLRAFWPGCEILTPPPLARPGDLLALPAAQAVPLRWDGRILRLATGPFAPPCFGARSAPAVLLAAEAADPVADALATPPAPGAAARAPG